MAHSRQLHSVIDAFGKQGWHCEPVENREVVTSAFEAHHTHIHVHAQAFPNLNALAVVSESPMTFDEERMALALELIMRANKQLTLGNFEYDFDRNLVVFRITNLFDKEVYDADIISSMVHCTIALAGVINRTSDDLLDDLSIPLLLEREDLLPPVPEGADGEEEEL
jgi:hypothetical protein